MIFDFFIKHSLVGSGVLHGMVDRHSHILPGVDDGFRDEMKSFQALALLEELGVRELWLTPHVMADMPNATSDLRERFKAFEAKYSGGIKLRLAAENMLDNLFDERMASDDLITMELSDGRKGLLVETSYLDGPRNLSSLLYDIKVRDLVPILAHPERYRYMNDENYEALKKDDVLFQLNYLSLTGYYGTTARKKALALLKRDFYDMAGSDLHSIRNLDKFINKKTIPAWAVEKLRRLMENPK